MKILFAVSNENISEAIIKKYENVYKEIVSSKNVYYFNAILKELQKDKSYDRIVISEDLEPFTNKNYETTDNVIFERLDRISDEAIDHTGEDIPIILIAADRHSKGDPILSKLFSIGIYSALIGTDRTIQQLCELINKPRTKREAKGYYRINTNDSEYKAENENDVSEIEIQNILAHYKRLGKNEEKYVESFNSIANQYNDQQLKVIIKFLPIGVKAVLEANSPKYQQIATFSGESASLRSQKPYSSSQINPKTNKPRSTGQAVMDNGIKIESIGGKEIRKPNKPVVIPGTLSTQNVRKMKPTVNTERFKDNSFKPQNNNSSLPVSSPANDLAVVDSNKIGVNDMTNDETNNMPNSQHFRRGRGRPRKVLTPEEIRERELREQLPRRGRGRPRKMQDDEDMLLNDVDEIENNDDMLLPGFDGNANNQQPIQQNPNNSMNNMNNNNNNYQDDDFEDFDDFDIDNFDNNENNYTDNANSGVENSNVVNNNNNNQEDDFDDFDDFDSFETETNQTSNTNVTNNTNNDLDDSDDLDDLGLDFDDDNNYDNYNTNNNTNNYQANNNNVKDNTLDDEFDDFDDFDLDYDEANSNNQTSYNESEDEDLLPGFDSGDDNTLSFDDESEQLPGVNDEDEGIDDLSNDDYQLNDRPNNNTQINNNTSYNNSYNANTTTERSNETKMQNYNNMPNNSLSGLISADKKIVAFVGTSKNGTSFLVNNLADIFSRQGIKTAILDLTKNRNAYYIYTKNEDNLRKIATESISKLASGTAQGIQVNKNLDVYTALPGEDNSESIDQYDKVLTTLIDNYSLVLLDCDFNSNIGYLREAQEIYLVQSMDVLTIQPFTAYLRDLKAKNVLEQEKLRIIINKYTRVRSVTEKTIIGGMAFYNDPSMSFMTDELFNREKIRYAVVPFEPQTYSKYLEGLINCNITVNDYPREMLNCLKKLADMVFPLVNGAGNQNKYGNKKYNDYNNNYSNPNTFSNQMNDTLDKMKRNF